MKILKTLTAAFALVSAAVAVAPAQADVVRNGFVVNGFVVNGFVVNGFVLNGFVLNGVKMNGFVLNGTTTGIEAVEPVAVTLPNGSTYAVR